MTMTIRILLGAIAAAAAAGVAAVAVLIVGVRTKDRRILDPFLRFQRDVANPGMMRTAGQPGQRTAVIHHVGRTSGNPYATPITPARVDDGFVVALPYGSGTQWVRNVLAVGSAVLVLDGERHEVTSPEVVPIASTRLARDEAGTVKVFGVTEALVLRA